MGGSTAEGTSKQFALNLVVYPLGLLIKPMMHGISQMIKRVQLPLPAAQK
jgi:hypothetical protein